MHFHPYEVVHLSCQGHVRLYADNVPSVTLLCRLNDRSRNNRIYQSFREAGRAVRTAVLLRHLSDSALREQIQRAMHKAEAYNGFTKWLHFGNPGWLTSRVPELQDKAVKFLDLVAANVVFSTAIGNDPDLATGGQRRLGPERERSRGAQPLPTRENASFR